MSTLGLDFRVSDSYGKTRQKRFKDFGFHWALLCCVDYDGAKGFLHDGMMPLGYDRVYFFLHIKRIPWRTRSANGAF